jgi:vancomycin permeability regulator SanA
MTDPSIERLFVRHPPRPADLGMVFGYHVPEGAAARARAAAALYRAGLVPLLLFTGGAPRFPGDEAESARMARVAEDHGVAEQSILLETASRNTFENALRSRDLLRQRGLLESLSRVILVSCSWHMGRIVRIMRCAFPAGIELLCCPQEETCTADTWQSCPQCRRRVVGEAELLSDLIGAGVLPEEA